MLTSLGITRNLNSLRVPAYRRFMQSAAGRSYDYCQPWLVLALSLTDGQSSAVGSGRVGNSRHISSPPSPSPYSYTAVAVLRISRDRRNRDRRDVAYQTASSRIGRDDRTCRGRCRRSRGRSEGGLTASVNRPEAHQLDVHQCHLAGVARHPQEAGKPGTSGCRRTPGQGQPPVCSAAIKYRPPDSKGRPDW